MMNQYCNIQTYHKLQDVQMDTKKNGTLVCSEMTSCKSCLYVMSFVIMLSSTIIFIGLAWKFLHLKPSDMLRNMLQEPYASTANSVQRNMHAVSPDRVISCYYNTPNPNETQRQLLPHDIHPYLCTHINVAFATVSNKTILLTDYQYEALSNVVKLKSVNPKLKILLSVGGAGGCNGYSEMVVNHASRKVFIKSIKNILRNFTLDGIDLDWEFPGVQNCYNGKTNRERQHFSQLLREIRVEYIREKRNYLLTVAVAAPQTIVDIAYDVDQLNLYVDYVNIMTYDFHSFTKLTPLTGLNSPLYARSSEQLFLATLNINYTVQMYMDKGLDENKIVIGIPTYGHSFTLVNPSNTAIGSPASGYGSLGGLGFVNYADICQFLIQYNDSVTVKQELTAKVPYLFKDKEWISYDTPQSVMDKAEYIKKHKLRGAMIYSLNADDYAGVCHGELGGGDRFPLSQSVKNTLINMMH